jgi:hypothetical protein
MMTTLQEPHYHEVGEETWHHGISCEQHKKLLSSITQNIDHKQKSLTYITSTPFCSGSTLVMFPSRRLHNNRLALFIGVGT